METATKMNDCFPICQYKTAEPKQIEIIPASRSYNEKHGVKNIVI